MRFQLDKKRKKRTKPSVTDRVANHPWRVQIVVGFVLVTVLGLLFAGLWYGTRLSAWQIRDIKVIGGSTITPAELMAIANNELQGAYFHVVPRRFVLWFPKTAIEAKIAALPRVHHVKVEAADHHTIDIIFDEYTPEALWCSFDASNTPCVFLDAYGYGFSTAPALNGASLVRYEVPSSTPTAHLQAFTSEYMHTTGDFVDRLQKERNLFVTTVIKDDNVDTSYVLSTGAELKVTNHLSTNTTLTNLASVLDSKDFKDIANGNFDYIDLRFGDKVFVCRLGAACSRTATTTATSSLTNIP